MSICAPCAPSGCIVVVRQVRCERQQLPLRSLSSTLQTQRPPFFSVTPPTLRVWTPRRRRRKTAGATSSCCCVVVLVEEEQEEMVVVVVEDDDDDDKEE